MSEVNIHPAQAPMVHTLGLLEGQAHDSANCWSTDAEVEEWFYGSDKFDGPTAN